MPVEHISLMPSPCLSLTNARQDTRQYKVTHQSLANQEFEQKGVLIAGVLYPLSPVPLPFSLPPYPLPLLTTATQAKF